MTFKRLLSLGTFVGCVLFLYSIAGAQTQTTTTTAKPTTTSTNPRVVVTDNLSQPTTPSTAAQPKTTTTKIGNYSVNVSDNIPAGSMQTMENGKFYNVTTWDGSKWVTTRKWMANPTKPNP